MKSLKVTQGQQGSRFDILVSKEIGITRSRVKTLIENGFIKLNNLSPKQGTRLHIGDVIDISLPPINENPLIPEPIDIDIIYQDRHLMVINKHPNMVMYPAAGNPRGTLLNAVANIAERLPDIGSPLRAGIVHRIDKDTSGVVVIALDNQTYYGLVTQFKSHTIKRIYIAIINGNIKEDSGEITTKISRSQTNRKKMATGTSLSRGRPAVTRWRVLERFKNSALIEARLLTGRTHQIRVHMSSISHSLLGDTLYGNKTLIEIKDNKKLHIRRQMLHAKSLGFVHPITNQELEFNSPLPEDMTMLIDLLKGQNLSNIR